MRAVSLVIWVSSENQIEKVVTLSGSGPDCLFLVMEALPEVGKKLGLTRGR